MHILKKVCYMTTSFTAIHFFYVSIIISRQHLKQSTCQGNCLYFAKLFAVIHYNKRSAVDSRKSWRVCLFEENHWKNKINFWSEKEWRGIKKLRNFQQIERNVNQRGIKALIIIKKRGWKSILDWVCTTSMIVTQRVKEVMQAMMFGKMIQLNQRRVMQKRRYFMRKTHIA